MLRSATRRAREAQGSPAAAEDKAPEEEAAAAAAPPAPAPPPAEKKRRVTREEREREEIRPVEVVAGEGGDDEGERGMDDADSADKLIADDEGSPPVPDTVSCSYDV